MNLHFSLTSFLLEDFPPLMKFFPSILTTYMDPIEFVSTVSREQCTVSYGEMGGSYYVSFLGFILFYINPGEIGSLTMEDLLELIHTNRERVLRIAIDQLIQ